MCYVPDGLEELAASFFSTALSRERVFWLLDRVFLFNFFYDSLLRHDRRERVDFVHFTVKIQGGSNMTRTDFCVNKPHMSQSYLNHLVYFSHHVLLACGPTLGLERESSHVCVHHFFGFRPANGLFT